MHKHFSLLNCVQEDYVIKRVNTYIITPVWERCVRILCSHVYTHYVCIYIYEYGMGFHVGEEEEEERAEGIMYIRKRQ